VTRLAEGALREREDLCGRDREYERRTAAKPRLRHFMMKGKRHIMVDKIISMRSLYEIERIFIG